jgi:hypothetical protein
MFCLWRKTLIHPFFTFFFRFFFMSFSSFHFLSVLFISWNFYFFCLPFSLFLFFSVPFSPYLHPSECFSFILWFIFHSLPCFLFCFLLCSSYLYFMLVFGKTISVLSLWSHYSFRLGFELRTVTAWMDPAYCDVLLVASCRIMHFCLVSLYFWALVASSYRFPIFLKKFGTWYLDFRCFGQENFIAWAKCCCVVVCQSFVAAWKARCSVSVDLELRFHMQ